MQKSRFIIQLLISFMIVGSACNKQKSPQELLKEENKAIERFISKNSFKILSEYPKDGTFKDNEFYRDATGLYIQVVDSGNGVRARVNQTVLGRFNGRISFKNDTIRYISGYQPDEFIYGRGTFSNAACAAWEYALQYVGDESEVSLIIPSKLGTYSDKMNYHPVYFESLKFTFY